MRETTQINIVYYIVILCKYDPFLTVHYNVYFMIKIVL